MHNIRTIADHTFTFGVGRKIAHPLGMDPALDGQPLAFMAMTANLSYLGHLEAMRMLDTPSLKLALAIDMVSTNADEMIEPFQLIDNAVRDGKKIDGSNDPTIVGNG